jgi:hypothetical protein
VVLCLVGEWWGNEGLAETDTDDRESLEVVEFDGGLLAFDLSFDRTIKWRQVVFQHSQSILMISESEPKHLASPIYRAFNC